MRKVWRWLILSGMVALSMACAVFLFDNVNRGLILPQETPEIPVGPLNLRGEEASIIHALRTAPWQGLRFLPKEKEWRFYGWTGETRQIKLSVAFDLIKVYYLEEDGDLTFTWVTTGVDIPGKGYVQAALSPVRTGELVAVRLFGKHVGQWGVDWDDCEGENCGLAEMIDTMLVLDDKGTGVTNGFIKYGWEPPTYPMYGFLWWSIEPLDDRPIRVSERDE